MTSKFTELCIDCRDPSALAAFWSEVLGLPVDREDDYAFLEDPQGRSPSFVFQPVPEEKTVKNRLHMDINPVDRDQAEEVERLEQLGATRADVGQGDVDWVVMRDPEGNEFCVLASRVEAS